MSKASSRHIRLGATRAAVVAAAAITATLALTPRALAGTLPADGNGNYTQILCADPTSGEGLGVGLPEGLTNPASIDTWQITTSWTNCPAAPITPADGIPLAVGQTNTYPQGTWSALLYQAPTDSTINAGRIWRVEHAEGADNGFMGIDQQAGEYQTLYSLPRNNEDSGDWYTGNMTSRGNPSQPLAAANLVNLTVSPDGSHWDVNATCDPNGNNNSSCTLNAQQWEYRIYAGEISLHAANDPQANNIRGPLTTEDPLKGNETIGFSATDQGPGLAYVKILADGKTISTETIDSNGGRCIPIPGHDPYTWAYQTPCKTSVGGRTYTLDTTQLSDGKHHIQVIIEDAAGNQSTVLDRTVTVQNTPPTQPTPQASPGSTLSSPAPGTGVLGSVAGAPPPGAVANGAPASETAQIHLNGRVRITRSYRKRALTITGRLTTTSGQPIAGATVDVSEQAAGATATRLIAHGKSSANGAFIIKVPGGPSRTITVGYRAYSTDPGYAAQGTVRETVSAGVQLRIAPRATNPTGTITLTGQVAGPIPHGGITIELLVRYHHQWQPFRDPQTNSHGRFHIRYQFQGAEGRFPFRAQALGGQSGFPYAHGDSNAVTITTG